jgi:hypothetical protein
MWPVWFIELLLGRWLFEGWSLLTILWTEEKVRNSPKDRGDDAHIDEEAGDKKAHGRTTDVNFRLCVGNQTMDLPI